MDKQEFKNKLSETIDNFINTSFKDADAKVGYSEEEKELYYERMFTIKEAIMETCDEDYENFVEVLAQFAILEKVHQNIGGDFFE